MLLELSQIHKTYTKSNQTVAAVQDVTLGLDAGDFVAVQGPSGCGKTTMLLIAGGLLAPDSGVVTLDGQQPYAMSREDRASFRGREVGFVFQQFHLIPYLNVLDNVLAPTLAAPNANASGRAMELLLRLGMEKRLDHLPAELSSGERQRTALARALLNRPRLLLADEPTGNLDRENAAQVLGYLTEFAQDGGAVLLVTHDPLAAEAAGGVLHMHDGQLVDQPVAASIAK